MVGDCRLERPGQDRGLGGALRDHLGQPGYPLPTRFVYYAFATRQGRRMHYAF